MDATKKPLLIPPEFSNYAEKHGIFQIYEVSDHYYFSMVSKTAVFTDLLQFVSTNKLSGSQVYLSSIF